MRDLTEITIQADQPLSWAQAKPIGDAVNAVLGGDCGCILDRGGRRYVFTRAATDTSDTTDKTAAPDRPPMPVMPPPGPMMVLRESDTKRRPMEPA